MQQDKTKQKYLPDYFINNAIEEIQTGFLSTQDNTIVPKHW